MEITVVSGNDIGTLFLMIYISTINLGPPLYIETKSAFVEEEKKVGEEGNLFLETMTRNEKRTSYDGEEIIKSMEPIFEYMTKNIEDMTKNIMKGFKFLAIQSWENILILRKPRGKMHQFA